MTGAASAEGLKQQVSLFAGGNGGTGYEPSVFDISARYAGEGRFWEASGGINYVSEIINLTGTAGIFWRKFGITAGLGGVYHAGFYTDIGVEQDFYGIAKLGFEFWKSGFALQAEGGFGVKLTTIYSAVHVLPYMKDLNGYYGLFARQKFGGVFTFAFGIRTNEYFVYNLGFTPNLVFFMDCAVYKNWSVAVTGVVKYSDMANDNSSPEGVSIKIGVIYRLGGSI